MSLPAITSGTLYAYRLFEVAEEVDLAVLGRLELPASVTIRPGRLSFFGRLRGLFSVATLGLSDVELEPGRWVQAETSVLVFSFGVAAACFQIPIGSATAAQAVAATLSPAEAARLVALLNGSPALTESAQKAVERLLQMIGPAVDRPLTYPEHETYTLLSVQSWLTPVGIDQLLGSADLARLLLGEAPSWEPAPGFLAQLTSHHYRYGIDDLCVIDWDAAVVVDPRPSEDIPVLLVLALTQFLEFQRYDSLLERELNVLYEWTSERPNHWLGLTPGRARRRVDQVNRLLLDIGEFVDRSQNAFKITEDVHYARIYRGAIERFQVPAWRSSVLGRQEAIAEIARTLYTRAQLSVSHFLELVIIALIAFEIVMAFAR
jgi:hypothetical protein